MAAVVFVSVNQAQAWSGRASGDCVDLEGSIIETLDTPVRPFGMVTDEDLAGLHERCSQLGGFLPEVETTKPTDIPPGAV